MNKSRIDFKNYEIVDSGAKFYKGKDCEEGFYHVCDEYAPGGTRLLEFMPEIYRHDISVSFCQTINGHSAMHPIKFCPICGKQLEYQGGTTMRDFIELLKAFGLFVSCLVIGYGGLFLFFY